MLAAETQERCLYIERGREQSCTTCCTTAPGQPGRWRSSHKWRQLQLPGAGLQQHPESSVHEGMHCLLLLVFTCSFQTLVEVMVDIALPVLCMQVTAVAPAACATCVVRQAAKSHASQCLVCLPLELLHAHSDLNPADLSSALSGTRSTMICWFRSVCRF